MNYQYIMQGFTECVGIPWEDIDMQISKELKFKKCRVIGDTKCEKEVYETLTCLLLDYDDFPPSIARIQQLIKTKYGYGICHIYTSIGREAQTFGRHCDTMDVLIVQSVGKMSYKFDDNNLIVLNPGDGIRIPKGVYHDPIPIEPRITLSFSEN